MSSRRPSIVVVFLCLGLFTAAPLLPLAEANGHEDLAHMPEWHEGDSWVWRKDPTSSPNSRSYGNLTWVVQGEQNLTLNLWESGTDEVEWRTQRVWRVMSWLNTTLPAGDTAFDIQQKNLMYRRVADHAMVRSEVDDSTEWTAENGTREGKYTVRHYERFAPLIELQYPLAVGDAWRTRADQRFVTIEGEDCGGPGQPSCRGGGPKVFTYEVIAKDRQTVFVNGQEQTFQTWRIKVQDETTGRYELWWYAEEVCNVVVREQYSNDRQKIGIFTLTSYQCSGETMADPDYSLWDEVEFSSTRFHDGLSEEALGGLRQRQDQTFFSPGPAIALVVVGLLGLAARVRRRD